MILVLLPAFNEEESIKTLFPKLIKELRNTEQKCKILVCDDGSRDNTVLEIEKFSSEIDIEIIAHTINRGLGETSRDLFERAAQLTGAGDVIIRMDCDDTHEPQYIPKLIAKVNEGFDVVIASRFAAGGAQLGVSRYRAIISYTANLFMKIFFPIQGLYEYSCGYRAYNAAIIKRAVSEYGNNFIQLKGLGFTCTLEKLVKLKLLGARFAEVPFVLQYDQKVTQSKMISSVTTLGYLVMTIMYHWPANGWRSQMRKSKPKV